MKRKFSLFLMCFGISVVVSAASDIAWKYDTSAREQTVPAPVVAGSTATEVVTSSGMVAAGSLVLADGWFWMLSDATAEGVIVLHAPGLTLFVR